MQLRLPGISCWQTYQKCRSLRRGAEAGRGIKSWHGHRGTRSQPLRNPGVRWGRVGMRKLSKYRRGKWDLYLRGRFCHVIDTWYKGMRGTMSRSFCLLFRLSSSWSSYFFFSVNFSTSPFYFPFPIPSTFLSPFPLLLPLFLFLGDFPYCRLEDSPSTFLRRKRGSSGDVGGGVNNEGFHTVKRRYCEACLRGNYVDS